VGTSDGKTMPESGVKSLMLDMGSEERAKQVADDYNRMDVHDVVEGYAVRIKAAPKGSWVTFTAEWNKQKDEQK
jgi:hypothetical protein